MKILFGGGGTGGHLFPGIALSEEFARQSPGSRSFFLTSGRPFDARELSAAGLAFQVTPAVGLSRRNLFRLPRRTLSALRQAIRALHEFRPDVVVGLGGYASLAAVLAAWLERVPFVLLEQNAIPGKVTRIFAPLAWRIYLQWREAGRRLPGCATAHVGSPVRKEAGTAVRRDEARKRLGVPVDRFVVAILGGSQGARGLNEGIVRVLAGLNGQAKHLCILHQTGDVDRVWVASAYERLALNARVFAFERRMNLVYAASELAICRAGALTIQELACHRVPPILVPFPQAADGHQLRNARLLERAGAAWVVPQDSLSSGMILRILSRRDPLELEAKGKILAALFPSGAASSIVRDVRRLVGEFGEEEADPLGMRRPA